MASPAARRLRLVSLLQRFGLPPASLPQRDPRLVVASLRTEFHRLAKECHPDTAAEGQKQAAEKSFVELRSDFEEAITLLESGVCPHGLDGTIARGGGASSSSSAAGYGWRPDAAEYVYERPRGVSFGETPKQESFDLKTRVKGNLVLWTGLFLFFGFMREFLVWSAGSTYAWNGGNGGNPFWIRRFTNDWAKDEETHRRNMASGEDFPGAPLKRKQSKAPEKKEREIDDFYRKRRISNVRRQYQPRGWGPSM